ncbi:MAG: response regulator [Cyanobacteria bacterium J06597_16]
MSDSLSTSSKQTHQTHYWEARPEQSTILVVDDNLNNLQLMCDVLEKQGYQVAIAQTGEQALEIAPITNPDIILLDIMMPGIDGFETCRRLKANPTTRPIPVIFMTALSDTVSQVKGLTLGAVDYITKPIKQAEVLARIEVHLALRKAQVELIQNEKMAALGQMVAGVAHEINNPVSFIRGNLDPVQTYAESLLSLVKLYETRTTPSTIQDFEEEIDLPFIKRDFVSTISSMQAGTERIQKIVQSLRTFSRLDESDQKAVDLNENIDSTLLLVRRRLEPTETKTTTRPEISIVKRYSALPSVACYPGKLNQVFLHLINNAIDALDEAFAQPLSESLSDPTSDSTSGSTSDSLSISDSPSEDSKPSRSAQPTITLSTALENGQVIIQVADNGPGIPKDLQHRIFDHFFTTKPVGSGTGLGLTISRTIICEDHQGQLTLQSQAGEGTNFTIALPLSEAFS